MVRMRQRLAMRQVGMSMRVVRQRLAMRQMRTVVRQIMRRRIRNVTMWRIQMIRSTSKLKKMGESEIKISLIIPMY